MADHLTVLGRGLMNAAEALKLEPVKARRVVLDRLSLTRYLITKILEAEEHRLAAGED
jgi:hypothetical protein